MSNPLSRRGLLGGLLAALVGLLTDKPQGRAEAKAPKPPVREAAPAPRATFHYDCQGNLMSDSGLALEASNVSWWVFEGGPNAGRYELKHNPPDKQSGEQPA